MLMDFIKNLNWIDISLVVVWARAIFIGIKTGFIVEFFKSLGLLFAIFITLHYYNTITGAIAQRVTFFEPTVIQIFVFLVLWFCVTFAFKLIRDGLMTLFSIKTHPQVDQWGGGSIAILRGLLVCSMTFFVLLLTENPQVFKVAGRSFSQHIVANLATGIYASIHEGLVVKFFAGEKLNEEAIMLPRLIEGNKK